MSGFDLSPELLRTAVIFIGALVVSTCFHEFGHAWVADRLGDRLPRRQGRVTLNPLAHADPIGTLLFPLLLILSSGGTRVFGWGKPVMTRLSPSMLPRGVGLRTARLLVSIAGPLMNVLLALVLSGIYVGLERAGQPAAAAVALATVRLNVILAFFNLLPIPPLDGRSILFWFFPEGNPVVRALDRYGAFLFLALLLMPSVLSTLMLPASWTFEAWVAVLRGWAAGG